MKRTLGHLDALRLAASDVRKGFAFPRCREKSNAAMPPIGGIAPDKVGKLPERQAFPHIGRQAAYSERSGSSQTGFAPPVEFLIKRPLSGLLLNVQHF